MLQDIAKENEELRRLVEEQKKEIERLRNHFDKLSCCCSGCTRHNTEIKSSLDGVGGDIW
jgi:predicted RNase H-like nuclease (RuvC/YqgF family)